MIILKHMAKYLFHVNADISGLDNGTDIPLALFSKIPKFAN